MSIPTAILVGLVGLAHFGFMSIEMFLWEKPTGMRIFRLDPEFAKKSRALAANMGLYNSYLGAGLIWSLFPIGAPDSGRAIATFFLICVIIAGTFAAATASRRILWIQAAPALLALILLWTIG